MSPRYREVNQLVTRLLNYLRNLSKLETTNIKIILICSITFNTFVYTYTVKPWRVNKIIFITKIKLLLIFKDITIQTFVYLILKFAFIKFHIFKNLIKILHEHLINGKVENNQ